MPENKTLPGAPIRLLGVGCCGSHTSSFGVGSLSLNAQRPGQWPQLDLAEIFFSEPTPDQLMDAETSPAFSEGNRARANIYRRLSREQAELLKDIVVRAINEKFAGEIPADDEIAEWRKANGF